MVKVFDMQFIRYINLFSKVTRVSAKHCFNYNNGLVFTSDRKTQQITYGFKEVFGWTGNPYLKLYNSQKKESTDWTEPVTLDENINSRYHDGPATFSKKEKP